MHHVTRYIIVKYLSMIGFSQTCLLIIYGNIKSTDNFPHGMASASLADNFTECKVSVYSTILEALAIGCFGQILVKIKPN